jgi:hypothetical protein
MKYSKLNRRMFLQGTGKTVLAIPFLSSLTSTAHGQAINSPKFFIFFPSNGGVPTKLMRPVGSGVNYVQTDSNTKMRKLTDILSKDGKINDIFGADWNIYASKMNIITHLNSYNSNNLHNAFIPGCADTHANRVRFVGSNTPAYEAIMEPRYSIDYCVRKSFIRQGYVGSIPQLHINIGYPDEQYEYSEFSYGDPMPAYPNDPGQAILALGNAQQLESLVFGKVPTGGNSTNTNGGKIKLVDAVIEDYRAIKNDRKISSLDKNRLQHAMDMWNDILNRWQNGNVGLSCSMPASIGSAKAYTLQNSQAVDIVTAAMACGITHVAAQAMIQHGDTFPGDDPAHAQLHGDNYNGFVNMYKWRMQFMKQYADRLTSLKDANGEPLMNSALLFHATEYADGGLHPLMCKTVVTIGEAGGGLKTGYHVHAGGAPFQRAHITAMKALGLTQNEIELKGTPGFGQYVQSNTVDDIISTGETFRSADSFSKFDNDTEKRKELSGLLG